MCLPGYVCIHTYILLFKHVCTYVCSNAIQNPSVSSPAKDPGNLTCRAVYMGSYRVHSVAKKSSKCITASYQRIATAEQRISQLCVMELSPAAIVFRNQAGSVLMSHPLTTIHVVSLIPQLPRGFGYVNETDDKALCHLFELAPEAPLTAAQWTSALEAKIALANQPKGQLDAVCVSCVCDWGTHAT